MESLIADIGKIEAKQKSTAQNVFITIDAISNYLTCIKQNLETNTHFATPFPATLPS